MNKNYDLSWDLKRLGTKVLLNKTYTPTYGHSQIYKTVDLGAKPEDLDNIKIEVEITENLYTRELGVSTFSYYYTPITSTNDGNEFNNYVTPQVYKTIYESEMPYNDTSYFSNMSITSARQLGYVSSEGVLMRNSGKMTITIPNPVSGQTKETEFDISIGLNADMKTRYYPDSSTIVTDSLYQQPKLFLHWYANGSLTINASDDFISWDHTRSNTVFKVKITAHGIFDM